MRAAVRLSLLLACAAALAAGVWMTTRVEERGRRDLGALVTVGGDAVRDSLQPAIDLTRMSAAEEARLGTAIDAEVRRHLIPVGDRRVDAYLTQLVQRIAAGVDRRDIPYVVTVVKGDAVNAFAVAGGRIYVTQGMIDFVQSEAELAAVLGHEISHVDLRHCVEQLQFERVARSVAPGLGDLARLGYDVMLLGFSEERELAADANGARLAAEAGYDPWAAVALFERLLPRDRGRTPTRDPVVEAAVLIPEALRRYVATHPPADQRMEAVRRALLARPRSWQEQRRYVGRGNLRDRRPESQDSRDEEWIVRKTAPA
jgi:predicted Zn-dependent protease